MQAASAFLPPNRIKHKLYFYSVWILLYVTSYQRGPFVDYHSGPVRIMVSKTNRPANFGRLLSSGRFNDSNIICEGRNPTPQSNCLLSSTGLTSAFERQFKVGYIFITYRSVRYLLCAYTNGVPSRVVKAGLCLNT